MQTNSGALENLTVVSWNTCRKSVRQMSTIIATLRWKYPNGVMAFQEVPGWTSADRSIIAGGRYEIRTEEVENAHDETVSSYESYHIRYSLAS